MTSVRAIRVVFGRKAGSSTGYSYSNAPISSNIVRTEETLDT
jgi:cytochrome c2